MGGESHWGTFKQGEDFVLLLGMLSISSQKALLQEEKASSRLNAAFRKRKFEGETSEFEESDEVSQECDTTSGTNRGGRT